MLHILACLVVLAMPARFGKNWQIQQLNAVFALFLE
jgi:hypothetical protein